MFVSKFSTEDWQGNQNKGYVQLVKEWQEIEKAIAQLDGHYKTLVTLETDGETHMAIGGGKNKYVVYLTFDNEQFYYIVEPSKSEAEENLTVGGQEGAYPAKLCIDINTALKAAKTFAEIGVMEKSVIWESDGVVATV
ncbi:Imm1 family immunity protein [Synechocystis sp. PCC 7509]|uniref:Imm1 family immunity protein n=1 Tax=Synechocystis sp. PCC 7509 TaxID=927677 RepID=UPI0002ABBDD7|nr:Imm1 family immunity protein [Synechocystis sp. PCC 7509]